jgi:hypothetical protein
VGEELQCGLDLKAGETRADVSRSAFQAPKRPRLYRVIVELPPRLLGTIVSVPASGWIPTPAWRAPLTIARFPTLIAGGDFIAGEVTTLGAVAVLETWACDSDIALATRGGRLTDHRRRCLADATLTAGLGGHLVDEGHEQPRLEICVYRYAHLPEGLRAIIDERATVGRRRLRARRDATEGCTVEWAHDWFFADGTCVTDLLAADCR